MISRVVIYVSSAPTAFGSALFQSLRRHRPALRAGSYSAVSGCGSLLPSHIFVSSFQATSGSSFPEIPVSSSAPADAVPLLTHGHTQPTYPDVSKTDLQVAGNTCDRASAYAKTVAQILSDCM